MKALLFAAATLLSSVLAVHAQTTASASGTAGRVEVELEPPKDDVPYTGEMILLRVRAAIHGVVVLDELRQPSLTNFSWQQLGRDKPIRMRVDGFDVPGIERDIAVFPQLPGRLIIEPFIRHVTLVAGDNQRIEADYASEPVSIDVQRHDALGQPGDWWLPASSLTYHDAWDPEPDEIARGQITHRTLTIEAAGVTADRLPPPPAMRAPGIIAFAGPVTRETLITAAGPVARAVYQWDIKPATNSPANLPALVIPWFDTGERHMRNLTVPHHWVSYAGIAAGLRPQASAPWSARLLARGPLMAGGAGLLWALSLGFLALSRSNAWTAHRGARILRALRRAARRGDAAALKSAILGLARDNPPLWRAIADDPGVRPRLAQLDASLYSRGNAPPPPLRPLARDIRLAWCSGTTPGAVPRALLPLDGAIAPPPPLSTRARSSLSRLALLAIRRKQGMPQTPITDRTLHPDHGTKL